MKNSQKGFVPLVLLLVIAGVLVVGGAGYWFYQNQNKAPELIGGQKDEHGCLGPAGYSWCEVKQKCLRVWEEPCEATTTTQASSADEFGIYDTRIAVGWKTYVNNEHGFEVKYLENWFPENTSNPDSLPITISGDDYILQIFDGVTGTDTPQGSVEKNMEYLNARAGRTVVSDEDAIPIGNGKAFYGLNSVPGDSLPTAWLVGKNQILEMQMTAVYPAGSANTNPSSQAEPLFKQILSTFKFNP